jgi:DNA-binding NtrC family response regulator
MPPLREIRADIPLLAMHFLRKQTKEMGREIVGFSSEALKALASYSWPGNVRELENEVKRAAVLTREKEISAADLSEAVGEERLEAPPQESAAPGSAHQAKQSIKDRVTVLEIQMIRDAMEQTGNDKRRTAKMLGLSHQGLLNKLKRYGLGV